VVSLLRLVVVGTGYCSTGKIALSGLIEMLGRRREATQVERVIAARRSGVRMVVMKSVDAAARSYARWGHYWLKKIALSPMDRQHLACPVSMFGSYLN
jgi:hypothetical protein